jgi:hypothetical protein
MSKPPKPGFVGFVTMPPGHFHTKPFAGDLTRTLLASIKAPPVRIHIRRIIMATSNNNPLITITDNLTGAMQDSLQDNPLTDAVLQFAQQHTQRPWSGTPADLLLKIGAFVPREIITTGVWPQNEISLSLRLKKLKSQLSGAGVDVVIGRRSKVRQVSVQYSGRSS